MDNQELKAFSEFLKLAESSGKRKQSLFETYEFKFASSVIMFGASIVGFRYFGDLLN
jgi:hypothetical protein